MTGGWYAFGYTVAGIIVGAALVMGAVDYIEQGRLRHQEIVVMLCGLAMFALTVLR